MKYFFEISYNGSRYNGWQSQNNGVGIQTIVEDGLTKLLREEIKIVGSGRTDTGVHCEQQFFHTVIQKPFEAHTFIQRVNAFLPKDIAIHSIRRVTETASARYDAVERTYQYRMVTEKNPFMEGLAWHFFKPLDVQTMNSSAALLLGEQDFQCFSKVKTDVKHFLCDIRKASWKEEHAKLEFTITANRFLRGMVRAIVGTLINIGTGKTSPEDLQSILQSRDRREAGANVPPYGLYLVNVKYPSSVFADEGELNFNQEQV